MICSFDSAGSFWKQSSGDPYAGGNLQMDYGAGYQNLGINDLNFAIDFSCTGGGGDPHFIGFRGNLSKIEFSNFHL